MTPDPTAAPGRSVPLLLVVGLIVGGVAVIGTAAWNLWGSGSGRSVTNAVIGLILGLACTALAAWELTRPRPSESS